jgi:hypothetical protein
MDDTDRLVARDPDALIPAFFGEVLRATVDRLDAGLVVAVHPAYLERRDYKTHAAGLIEAHVKIPEIPNASAMTAILNPRVAYASSAHTLVDAFHADAITELHGSYLALEKRSVRAVLAIAHAALARAHKAARDLVDVEHIQHGVTDALLA